MVTGAPAQGESNPLCITAPFSSVQPCGICETVLLQEQISARGVPYPLRNAGTDNPAAEWGSTTPPRTLVLHASLSHHLWQKPLFQAGSKMSVATAGPHQPQQNSQEEEENTFPKQITKSSLAWTAPAAHVHSRQGPHPSAYHGSSGVFPDSLLSFSGHISDGQCPPSKGGTLIGTPSTFQGSRTGSCAFTNVAEY